MNIMNSINWTILRLAGLCLTLFMTPLCTLSAQSLKVFILAGQSNAQGHGDTRPAEVNGTLLHFMENGGSQEFGFIQDENDDWVVRDDVWVRYDHEAVGLISGELSVGYGDTDTQIGPEFALGHLLGDFYPEDKVLIIKTCWGGKSLAEDFRPPTSGGAVGPYYAQMIGDINDAINNIATEFPDYNNEAIEMAGFIWFQGWNDASEPSFLDEYEQNLINLISDVRKDLEAPDMPVVVGLTGNGGWVAEPFGGFIGDIQTRIVPAQINAANYAGHTNVCYAETRDFWRPGSESPEPDFAHHWNNNAESYLRIGNEFGIQMIELLQSNCTNMPKSGVHEASAYGFNYFYKEEVADASYGAGYSFYSAVWPFMQEYPGATNYQTGQGTWLGPQISDEELTEDYYNTIEGGLGWWGDTRFGTEVPKFIMGGVANSFEAFANGPAAGSTDYTDEGERDWSSPSGKYGVAQLTPNLLWPPDGLNMDQSMNGEFLGYGYHPLPFTDPLATTNGVDIATGNQCWTLFMNTTNFKGPIAFFLPTFWTSVVLDDPETYEGLFLDSRLSDPNMSFAQEFSAAPAVIGVDESGGAYARIIPPVYPKTTNNSSVILRDVSVYSRDAKWNEVENWFNGGAVPSTALQSSGTLHVDFAIDNNDPPQVDAGIWTGTGPEVDTSLNQNNYAQIKMSNDRKSAFLEWNTSIIDEVSTGFIMPEYYRINEDNVWEQTPRSNVPESTGILDHVPLTNPNPEDFPYLTPLEEDCHYYGEDSPWTSPGPATGPFTTLLGDGTQLTYYWYRFIDQPAVILVDLPENMRQDLQERVERIHTHWGHTDEYLPGPTGGSLASLDDGLLVTPPPGLEVGFVPIVSRQEYVGAMTTTAADLEVKSTSIQLNPNPTSGVFTIQGEFQNYSIQVISQNGAVYQDLTDQASPIQIDITALPSGIYFVRVLNTLNNQLSFENILKF